jgi:N-acetylated-alpha-linked acidic dipeptidase
MLVVVPELLWATSDTTAVEQSQFISGFRSETVPQQLDLEERIRQAHLPETYREHLFNLTQHPNVAGTPQNRLVIDYLTEVSRQAGLQVRHYDYDVWLAEPGEVSITIVSPDRIELPNKEQVFAQDPYTSHPDLGHGWNAYSGSGDVTAEIVYANYGRREDFRQLQEMGVDVRGKIVLARYGGNFRGFKAKFAEEAGAAGLIIYTDPANGGFINGTVYPDGIFSNASAIQRGSLLTLDYFGDPLTPFEPALPIDGDIEIERLNPDDVGLHTIPVAPIGYGAAEYIFNRMLGENQAPESWQGGFPFPYRLTGGPELQVNLRVDQPQSLKRITNVVATIEGSTHPDEWIILGSHFDAWGFGATDPNSGTAMLLTLTESLGSLLQEGFQPKRSIMIAHWDAEEFLIIGSTEWVEQLRDELQAGAIAYINADMSVTGPSFGASASPSLKQPIIEASTAVIHPDTNVTLYESWHRNIEANEPPIGNLGGGSDHVPLYMHAGIPSAGVAMRGSVPIYHTNYDTFWFYETHIDSTFRYGPALASYYGVLATRLANADIIPYDIERYGNDIYHHLNQLSIRARELDRPVEVEALFEATNQLQAVSRDASILLIQLLSDETLTEEQRTIVNKRLIQLERSFLHEEGMPFGAWFASLYASINPFSGYESWMLPGIRYVIEERASDEELQLQKNRLLEAIQQLTVQLEQLTVFP